MKTNKEDKNKGCVETLKIFYSLVFKLAMPSKSGGFLVRCPERTHYRYGAFGSGGGATKGCVIGFLVQLFSLCVCLSLQTEETLAFPCCNYLIILTPWGVASPQCIVSSRILHWGVSRLREKQLTGNKF